MPVQSPSPITPLIGRSLTTPTPSFRPMPRQPDTLETPDQADMQEAGTATLYELCCGPICIKHRGCQPTDLLLIVQGKQSQEVTLGGVGGHACMDLYNGIVISSYLLTSRCNINHSTMLTWIGMKAIYWSLKVTSSFCLHEQLHDEWPCVLLFTKFADIQI